MKVLDFALGRGFPGAAFARLVYTRVRSRVRFERGATAPRRIERSRTVGDLIEAFDRLGLSAGRHDGAVTVGSSTKEIGHHCPA